MNTIPRAMDFTNKDLQEIYRRSEAADVVALRTVEDELMERIHREPGSFGMPLPWRDLDDKIRLRTGEISVWAGINGHKKSTIISQVALHIAMDCPVGIASFEMKLTDTAHMMCKQVGAVDNVHEELAKDFLDWADNRLWMYRALGGVLPLEVLGAISALADKGCKLIVIDNLQFCGVTDDIEKERLFVNQLVGLSDALDVHIAVVHHVRKPASGGDEYVPTRFDVRGGGTIVDQAHYLFICWHNKQRATWQKFKAMGQTNPKLDEKMKDEPDFKLILAKQRHAEFEGSIRLYQGKGQTFKRHETSESLRVKIPRKGGYAE